METTTLESLTVNEIIRQRPETVEVFNRYGIDACCGGAVPVAQAAARDGADPADVLRDLDDAIKAAR